MYYHAMPLNKVQFGKVLPNPEYSIRFFQPAYRWIERELGYYPFFLAVAQHTETIYTMTGFNANFKTRITCYDFKNEKLVNCRNLDRKPHNILFRFSREAFERLDYQDYDAWHFILNIFSGEPKPKYLRQGKGLKYLQRIARVTLKPSWAQEEWHKKLLTSHTQFRQQLTR